MKKLTLLFMVLLFTVPCLAQEWIGSALYQAAVPTGDTKTFVDAASFRGVALDFRKTLDPNTTFGVFFGWNIFYKRLNETIELKTPNPGALTGLQDRTLNAFPIMLNVHRYFGDKKAARPYVGLNAGGFYMVQRLDIGIYSFQKDEWQWGAAPEFGVLVPVKGDNSIILNLKYNYAFTGESPIGADVNNAYWTIGLGYAWNEY